MTSNMVASRVDPLLSSHALALPFFAISPITASQLFPIVKWAPRTGRSADYASWWRNDQQLLHAFGLTAEQLDRTTT